MDTSTFDLHLWNKNKVAFLLMTPENVVFGGFVYTTINHLELFNEEKGTWECICDPQQFVFTFKDNNPMKFDIRKDAEYSVTFHICTHDILPLFAFGDLGNYEIYVVKKDNGRMCVNQPKYNSIHDYGNIEKALLGWEWNGIGKDALMIERIVVVEFN